MGERKEARLQWQVKDREKKKKEKFSFLEELKGFGRSLYGVMLCVLKNRITRAPAPCSFALLRSMYYIINREEVIK
jgi:hypothetical protein